MSKRLFEMAEGKAISPARGNPKMFRDTLSKRAEKGIYYEKEH